MVVVTIGMLLVGGATLTTSKYLARERLSSAVTELVSIINIARSYATTNQTPSGFVGLDYVAITLSANGLATIVPVNNINGVGTSYVSKNISSPGITFTQINIGGLQFAAGNAKLLGKNPDPSYLSYPLPASTSVGITISSAEVTETRHVTVGSYGAVNTYKL